MKTIVLDNSLVCGLYPFLAGPKMTNPLSLLKCLRISVKDKKIEAVACNGAILGCIEKPLKIGEECEDFSVCIPLQDFGKAALYKNDLIVLGTDDYQNFILNVGRARFNFAKELGVYPNWQGNLIGEQKELLTQYRVFSPSLSKTIFNFLQEEYFVRPYTNNNKVHGPIWWETINGQERKIAIIAPMKVKER